MKNRPAVWLVLLAALASPAKASSGTEGAAFLDIPVGAGPAALGSAYTALATDAYASVYNPAGLGFLPSTQVAAQHLSYLESISYEFASAAFRLKEGHALAVSAQYLGSGDIPGAALSGAAQPSYSSYFGSYNLAYGQSLGEKLSLGLTGKVINAKIADVTSNAYAGDLGALYKVSDHATLAATLTNLGTKLKFLNDDSSLPVAGHLAAAYAPSSHWLASFEGVFPKSGPAGAHIGLQWQPLDLIAIRAGYKTETTKELSALAGMSAGIGLKFWGQEFAYAWVPYGDLGDTQYFSLLLKFGAKEEDRKNLIQYQTIKKHRSVKGKATSPADVEKNDPEYQQFMELLKDSESNKTAQKADTPKQEQNR